MTQDGIARRVELTGGSTVVLGVICLGLAALEVAIPVLLRRLDESAGLAGDEGLRRLVDTFAAGAALSASINAAFGLALVVVGLAVSRRARWSHAGLAAVCWASIPAVAALAAPTLRPLWALSDAPADSRWLLPAASVLLTLLQIVAVVWFLRFWRREEVRAFFR